MHRKRIRKGFTLVEIMIVLAILVLLVAMVGPRLLRTQEKADLQLAKTQIDNLDQTLDFYKVDNRVYPTTEEGLKALLTKPSDEARAKNWQGPYLDGDALPVDPWGNPFQYEFPPTKGGAADKPNIWSFGPDGQDATEDDITNWTTGGENGSEGEMVETENPVNTP